MNNPKLCLLGPSAPAVRKVLPDRAFDAMMLMGARPQKKVSL